MSAQPLACQSCSGMGDVTDVHMQVSLELLSSGDLPAEGDIGRDLIDAASGVQDGTVTRATPGNTVRVCLACRYATSSP